MFLRILRAQKASVATLCRMSGLVVLIGSLAGCNSTGPLFQSEKTAKVNRSAAKSAYGAKPDLTAIQDAKSNLPKVNGRAFIGKPYKVKNRWYYPKDARGYVKVGHASWYGPYFHGRRTANGEIFNMNKLTAAHPTMPLPSYARVTNLKNGSSVIVRVNDRGPFAANRVIDVSKKAAELLKFKSHGIAKVKVEYVGPASVRGKDSKYLMASYNTGSSDPSTLMALADENKRDGAQDNAFNANGAIVLGYPQLPESGPTLNAKPSLSAAFAAEYTARNVQESVFDNILTVNTKNQGVTPNGEYVDVGAFTSQEEADRLSIALRDMGRIENRAEKDEKGDTVYTVSLYDAKDVDTALEAAWAAGATEAFVVRTN